MKRNDIIAVLVVSGLITLGVLDKLDWGATVAYIIGLLSKQPTVVSPPAPGV
jgi:hypothetical protein